MIELHGVTKSVPSGNGTLTILHPLDLTIERGSVEAPGVQCREGSDPVEEQEPGNAGGGDKCSTIEIQAQGRDFGVRYIGGLLDKHGPSLSGASLLHSIRQMAGSFRPYS